MSSRKIPRIGCMPCHPWSIGVDALARELKIPRPQVMANRWQSPDGSYFYHPRFRWCLLIKAVIEKFCPIVTPTGVVVYVGDTETKFVHFDTAYLTKTGITLDAAAAKMPDVIIHDVKRNWLFLIEAVTGTGPVDGKRRSELKQLFKGSNAGLVFVTAFETREAMQALLGQIAWESEVWIAEAPDHLIHLNGERSFGPYPDAMPQNQQHSPH